MPSVPLQLRIDFADTPADLSVHLTLSGWTVLCHVDDDRDREWWRVLIEAGVNPSVDDIRGVSFPLVDLAALTAVPATVTVTGDEHLAPMLALAADPPTATAPATVRSGTGGDLELSWRSATGVGHRHPLTNTAAAKLPTLGLAFLASADAWGVLAGLETSAGVIGSARVNLDGFVEIATAVPQLVEAAPVRGLFRIDPTHFGVPAAYAADLDAVPGFVWYGNRPYPDDVPETAPLPFPLSTHAAADLDSLVATLTTSGSAVLAWPSGLGRRVAALAALHRLDAFPALIVCPPSALWPWQRHLDLAGRTCSLRHDHADVRLVTFDELADVDLPSAAAVVVDGLGSPDPAIDAAVSAALHRLDGLTGAYRVGLTADWPAELRAQVRLLESVRPAEFTAAVPLEERYPLDASRRAGEHVAAYVLHRSARGGDTVPFRRSATRALPATDAQRKAAAETVRRHGGDHRAALAELLEISASGPPTSLSPKVAAAVDAVRAAAASGRRLVLLCRSRRFAALAAAMSAPVQVATVEPGGRLPGDAAVVVARFDGALPDVSGFDEVVVADYPWSTSLIDDVAGAATGPGPQRVTVLHLSGSVDDRLARVAAARREVAAVTDPAAALTDAETAFLLDVTDPAAAPAGTGRGHGGVCDDCGGPRSATGACPDCDPLPGRSWLRLRPARPRRGS